MPTKPKALYLRPEVPSGKAGVYLNLFDKRETALAQFFELLTPDNARDSYDIILYNVHDYLKVPAYSGPIATDVVRVCLLSIDAVSQSLLHIISYFEEAVKPDAYFVLDVSSVEYAPSIAHKLYYWPWGVHEADFTGLQSEKNTDILLTTGNFINGYHWRQRIFPLLREHFETENFGHFQTKKRPSYGRDFNSALSRARIVPTCGGFNKIFVLKHLEIPAAGSLLLTEETEAVKQAGFVDGENCLFADEQNAVEKCRAILNEPDRYSRIVAAGKELVFSKHEYRVRNPVYEWFRLQQQGIKDIRQQTPFEALEEGDNTRPWRYIPSMKPIVSLNINKLQAARAEDKDIILHYINDYFLNYPGFIYRAGLFFLCAGKPEKAYLYFLKIFMAVQSYKDPILLAQLALTCAALGKVRLAKGIRATLISKNIRFKRHLLEALLSGEQIPVPKEEASDYHGLYLGDVKAFLDFLATRYKGVAAYLNAGSTELPAYTDEELSQALTSVRKMPLRVQWLKGKIAMDRKLANGRKYKHFKFY